MRTKMINNLNL